MKTKHYVLFRIFTSLLFLYAGIGHLLNEGKISQDLPVLFNTGGIPATFIFNEAGELIKQHNGADDYNTDEY